MAIAVSVVAVLRRQPNASYNQLSRAKGHTMTHTSLITDIRMLQARAMYRCDNDIEYWLSTRAWWLCESALVKAGVEEPSRLIAENIERATREIERDTHRTT